MDAVGGVYSLVECRPLTGRTHQIRAHLAHVGHALVADTKYGKKQGQRDARSGTAPRLFLHCARLSYRTRSPGRAIWSVDVENARSVSAF